MDFVYLCNVFFLSTLGCRIWCHFLSKMVRILLSTNASLCTTLIVFMWTFSPYFNHPLRPVWRQGEGPHPSRDLPAACLPTAAGGVWRNAGREAGWSRRGERVSHWRTDECVRADYFKLFLPLCLLCILCQIDHSYSFLENETKNLPSNRCHIPFFCF